MEKYLLNLSLANMSKITKLKSCNNLVDIKVNHVYFGGAGSSLGGVDAHYSLLNLPL